MLIRPRAARRHLVPNTVETTSSSDRQDPRRPTLPGRGGNAFASGCQHGELHFALGTGPPRRSPSHLLNQRVRRHILQMGTSFFIFSNW
jgi:hypothetical protein